MLGFATASATQVSTVHSGLQRDLARSVATEVGLTLSRSAGSYLDRRRGSDLMFEPDCGQVAKHFVNS